MEEIIKIIEESTSVNEKGRALEELATRLFSTIEGFTVISRVLTETEEIDIAILNNSQASRFHREKALILVECKNWTGKCGKNELVLFKEKLFNRKDRCSLGILVSWNGFADTINKELLRGSREEIAIILLSKQELIEGVESSNFIQILNRAWDQTMFL